MVGPPVACGPVLSSVMVLGQAPGPHEASIGRPFAWTAGKTLFGWLAPIGLTEAEVRARIYFAAVCRCFPGKSAGGGDRVPDAGEVARCAPFLATEVRLLRPELVIPVGKLAIAQVLPAARQLVDVIGTQHRVRYHRRDVDLIPLPHPSGASTWHRMEPGKALLGAALARIAAHPAWQALVSAARAERGPAAAKELRP